MSRSGLLKAAIATPLAIGALAFVWKIYLSGQPLWAVLALAVFGVGFYVYLSERSFAYRYLFPGLAGMAVFVVFPLVFTVQIGFTNYSSGHLLDFDRATAYLLEQTEPGEGRGYAFTLHAAGPQVRLLLQPKPEEGAEEPDPDDPAAKAALRETALVTPPLALQAGAQAASSEPSDVAVVPLKDAGWEPNEALTLAEVLKQRAALSKLRLKLPDGSVLSYAGVHDFAPVEHVWKRNADGSLTQLRGGAVARVNAEDGYYETADGTPVQPGFKVGIGLGNYRRMLEDREFRGPFVQIFGWTVVFASMTVLLTLVVGCTLAVLLNWEALRFRTVYRTLLFLPYAVPGFISILVFRGLFNQNFGEINHILDALFGIKPAWFADPFLAKVMILVVNTWLGYPYIMVLCTGLIKSIPSDLYEASAIAGAGPLTNFFRITAPLILKPLMPLLIASFAFNFNNFVLIALLTNGRPDFLNTKVPAGTTDILVSYTYRIAFEDSGQNFGLAAAISTVIFALVALLSALNLRLTQVNRQEAR